MCPAAMKSKPATVAYNRRKITRTRTEKEENVKIMAENEVLSSCGVAPKICGSYD